MFCAFLVSFRRRFTLSLTQSKCRGPRRDHVIYTRRSDPIRTLMSPEFGLSNYVLGMEATTATCLHYFTVQLWWRVLKEIK